MHVRINNRWVLCLFIFNGITFFCAMIKFFNFIDISSFFSCHLSFFIYSFFEFFVLFLFFNIYFFFFFAIFHLIYMSI